MNSPDKSLLRTLLKQKRGAISSARKNGAAEQLFSLLVPLFGRHSGVLSFSSLIEEIDTTRINAHLENEGKLLLPRVEGDRLEIYRVTDSATQLRAGGMHILEPNPNICTPISSFEEIGLILVPGLGFDHNGARIGYGKGHYDRLLFEIKKTHVPMTIGIGFSEQLLATPLPLEPHDEPLHQLILV